MGFFLLIACLKTTEHKISSYLYLGSEYERNEDMEFPDISQSYRSDRQYY